MICRLIYNLQREDTNLSSFDWVVTLSKLKIVDSCQCVVCVCVFTCQGGYVENSICKLPAFVVLRGGKKTMKALTVMERKRECCIMSYLLGLIDLLSWGEMSAITQQNMEVSLFAQ